MKSKTKELLRPVTKKSYIEAAEGAFGTKDLYVAVSPLVDSFFDSIRKENPFEGFVKVTDFDELSRNVQYNVHCHYPGCAVGFTERFFFNDVGTVDGKKCVLITKSAPVVPNLTEDSIRWGLYSNHAGSTANIAIFDPRNSGEKRLSEFLDNMALEGLMALHTTHMFSHPTLSFEEIQKCKLPDDSPSNVLEMAGNETIVIEQRAYSAEIVKGIVNVVFVRRFSLAKNPQKIAFRVSHAVSSFVAPEKEV